MNDNIKITLTLVSKEVAEAEAIIGRQQKTPNIVHFPLDTKPWGTIQAIPPITSLLGDCPNNPEDKRDEQ